MDYGNVAQRFAGACWQQLLFTHPAFKFIPELNEPIVFNLIYDCVGHSVILFCGAGSGWWLMWLE
eukprot:2697750-Prorocentrum_lima.AAC.1